MKTVNVAVCDDEEFFLEALYSLVSTGMNENMYTFTITKYMHGRKLIEDYETKAGEYDLVFLDIDMPGMSGMEVAQNLRKKGYGGVICFVTSHDKYALDAYGVDALGYLIKPARYVDVKRLIEKAVVQIYYQYEKQEAEKRFLEISIQGGKRTIDINKILYIEKRRNQSVIHMEDGEAVCYESLKSLYDRLNQNIFCYAHQGFVVNFDKIKEVTPTFIALGHGREVPVSRKYQKVLRERHMDMIHQIQAERRLEREKNA